MQKQLPDWGGSCLGSDIVGVVFLYNCSGIGELEVGIESRNNAIAIVSALYELLTTPYSSP